MSDIQKLTYPYFTDGTTQLNAANLNPIIAKINEVIDKVNGGVTPTIDISSLFTTWENGAIKWADGGTQSSTAFEMCALVDISAYAGKTFNYSRIARDNVTSMPVGLAFYDSSEAYISGQGLHTSAEANGWEDYDVEIPSNAKYIRMSWYSATGSGAEWHDDFYAKIKG